MINQDTINQDTMTFWSIFSDKELTDALNQILEKQINYTENGIKKIEYAENNLNEGKKTAKAGGGALRMVGKFGKEFKTPIKISAYSGAAWGLGTGIGYGVDKIGSGVEKFGDGVKSLMNDLSDGAKSTTSAAWGLLGVVAAGAALWALIKHGDKLISPVKRTIQKFKSGKCLAKCNFESEGIQHEIKFDSSNYAWQFTSDASDEDKKSFFQSDIFDDVTKTFNKQFEKYLNNEAFNVICYTIENAKDKYIDSNLKEFKSICNDRQKILSGLSTGKYRV